MLFSVLVGLAGLRTETAARKTLVEWLMYFQKAVFFTCVARFPQQLRSSILFDIARQLGRVFVESEEHVYRLMEDVLKETHHIRYGGLALVSLRQN